MDKFWKVIILIVIAAGVMLLITIYIPDVKAFAKSISLDGKLPFWLVGLAAPILFVLDKIKKFLGGLFQGGTEKEISKENEKIKAEMIELRKSVDDIEQRRRESVDPILATVARQKQTATVLERQATAIDSEIAQQENSLRRLQDTMTADEGVIE